MKYVSTRGHVEPIEFTDAVLMGLADDGGLLLPESIPDARDSLENWPGLPYNELAFQVLRLYATDVPERDLKTLIDRSYGETFDGGVAPTIRLGRPRAAAGGDLFILELWHGPTMSFKDVALQFLGNLFEYALNKHGSRMNILAATSGDTGSAAICGARGRRGIHIFVMHPHKRVSPIQERQMTTVLDDNVHNIAIKGSFDDCQRIMKTLAADLDFKRKYSLGAVNSVNWARVLAQMVYYFAGAFDVQRLTGAEKLRFCVPTGNFGDILAGWYAMQMGAPISQLILATNENDILSRFFNTGVYSLGAVHHTLSPAMDIQVASNFERYLYYKVGCDAAGLSRLMAEFSQTGSLQIEPDRSGLVDPAVAAGMGSKQQCLETIRKYYEQYGYLLDPHTAVGVAVAESQGLAGEPVICLATAHPAKFPDAIKQATGMDLAHHPKIDALKNLPTRCEVLPNDKEALRRFIIDTIGH